MKKPSVAGLLVGLLLTGLAISIPVAWTFGGYLGIPVTEVLGFRVDDGVCARESAPIGVHCFSDFTMIAGFAETETPWHPDKAAGNPYPASAWLIPVSIYAVGMWLGGLALATLLFLAVSAVAALVPAAWAGRHGIPVRLPLLILILGLGSAPLLVALDRGNSTALLVVPVFWLMVGIARDQRVLVIAGLVVAALIRPQMLVMAVVLLPLRRFRDALVVGGLTALGWIAGFLIWPGNRVENIRNWIDNMVSYSSYGTVDLLYPYNLSANRSLLTLSDLLGISSLLGEMNRGHVVNLLTRFSFVPGLVIIIVTVIVLLMRRRSVEPATLMVIAVSLVVLVPGTSFSYYLILLLPVAAVIIRDPNRSFHSKDSGDDMLGILDGDAASPSRLETVRKAAILSLLVVALVPLAIPIPSSSLGDFSGVEYVGLMQILWGPVMLVVWAVLIGVVILSDKAGAVGSSESANQNQITK